MLAYNKKLKQLSRNLRRNMTDAESLLWSRLRNDRLKGLRFYRQKIIGDYIVDFYCPGAKTVIEVDGGQHYSPEGKREDVKRTAYLREAGITVIRFSDRDVLTDIDTVVKKIWEEL
jgi:very-short-patch-repair endonuclease